MTALPYPPSKDFRAAFAGDVPYIRDIMNPYRTSPAFPQNLLRVTRRGADDVPTPEEQAIMSNLNGLGAVSPIVASRLRGVLAGLGKGGQHGGGGHHHGGGGHHHGGRRGRGGWGGGWYGGGYDGDTIIIDTPQCPYGYVWDAANLRCIMATGMRGLGHASVQQHVTSMRAPTGGGSRPGYAKMRRDVGAYSGGPTMPRFGALRAGGYMGAVGRMVDAPSIDGAALRGQVQRVVLSGAGVGDLCSDQGAAMAFGLTDAFSRIAGGLIKNAAGSGDPRASAAGGALTDAGFGINKTYQRVCSSSQQPTSQTPPSGQNADDLLKSLHDAGLLGQPAAPAPAPVASTGISTTTLVIGGAAALGLLGAAWFFFK